MYLYGVDNANYIFIWVIFLSGDCNKWKMEYWGDVSSIFGL